MPQAWGRKRAAPTLRCILSDLLLDNISSGYDDICERFRCHSHVNDPEAREPPDDVRGEPLLVCLG